MINLYLGAKILNSFNPAKYFAFFCYFSKTVETISLDSLF